MILGLNGLDSWKHLQNVFARQVGGGVDMADGKSSERW